MHARISVRVYLCVHTCVCYCNSVSVCLMISAVSIDGILAELEGNHVCVREHNYVFVYVHIWTVCTRIRI